MKSFKAVVSLLLKGFGATLVFCSALLYIDSMFTMTHQKGVVKISSENKTHARSNDNVIGSISDFSKNKTIGSITRSSPKPINLYTGNASSWKTLPDEDLSMYFTPAEISGIESQSCGDVENASNPWQWQGNTQGRGALGMGSGPCCPNGHTYGWFSQPLQDTTPLRKVEVTSDGQTVGPFQVQALLAALHQKKQHLQQQPQNVTKTSAAAYSIWILGDSTSNQLFFAFLCAIIRIGGAVEMCKMLEQSHYSHPLCQLTPNAKREDLDTTTFDNIDHQYVILILPDRRRIELHHFSDGGFCYYRETQYCQAYGARFLNLARETLSPPDLFLVNMGLHKRSKQALEKGIQGMLALLSPFLKSVVWRSTSITHFPDIHSTGYFENYAGERASGQVNATACQDVFNEKSQWRLQVAHEWLEKNYGNEMANQTKIPILSMNETEVHMFETYGGPQSSGKLDCVHHIYTPLYYDSFFWRLSQLLLLEEQQRKTPHRPNRFI
jgi:hypothetical protein